MSYGDEKKLPDTSADEELEDESDGDGDENETGEGAEPNEYLG